MHERLHAARDAARAGAATCEGLSAAGGRQLRREYQAEEANGPGPAILAAGGRRHKPRQEISIGENKQISPLRDGHVPWSVVLRQLPAPVTKRNAKKIMTEAAVYRAMPDDARTLRRNNCREGKWPKLDALVYKWYLAVNALGHY